MKVGPPVSGDLLVKLALIAGGIALAVYLVRRSTAAVTGAVGSVVETVGEVADSIIVGVNPTNPDNWVNQAVTGVGASVVSPSGPGRNADGSWTVGGWLYDLTHADPVGPTVVPARNPYSYGGPSTGVYGVAPVATVDNFDFQGSLGWGGA